jgi:hypothetical protein
MRMNIEGNGKTAHAKLLRIMRFTNKGILGHPDGTRQHESSVLLPGHSQVHLVHDQLLVAAVLAVREVRPEPVFFHGPHGPRRSPHLLVVLPVPEQAPVAQFPAFAVLYVPVARRRHVLPRPCPPRARCAIIVTVVLGPRPPHHEEPLELVVGRRQHGREHRGVRCAHVGGAVHAAPKRVPGAEAGKVELREHLWPHVGARAPRRAVEAEPPVERPAARRVHLAHDHVERPSAAGAAVAVLLHAPLGLPRVAGLRGVLVVAEAVAVPPAAGLRLAGEAVRPGPGPPLAAEAPPAADEEEPLGPGAVGGRVHLGEERRVRAVDVGVVDLRRQVAAPQRAARGQVPSDEVVRGGVEVERRLADCWRPVPAAPRWPQRPAPGRRVAAAAGAEENPAVVGHLLAEAGGRRGRRRGLLHCSRRAGSSVSLGLNGILYVF